MAADEKKTMKPAEQSNAQEILNIQEVAQIGLNKDNLRGFDTEGNIILNGEKRPELNPNSPEFNPVLYQKYISNEIDNYNANLEQIKKTLSEITQKEISSNAIELNNIINTMQEMVEVIKSNVASASTFKTDVLNDFAMVNFGARLAMDKLANNSNISQEQLLNTANDFGKKFSTLMMEELQEDIYQGKSFLTLFKEDAILIDGGKNLEIKENSLLERAVNNVFELCEKLTGLTTYKASPRELPGISPITKPSNYSMLNSKVANQYMALQDLLTYIDADGQLTFFPIDAIENEYPVTIKDATKRKGAVLDVVSLSYDGELTGKAAKIGSYDKSILNTICSILEAGNKVFLIDDIYKTMTQKSKATDAQIERIKTSLKKLKGHTIRINVSEEIKERLLTIDDDELICDGVIEDQLLHFRTLTMRTDKGKIKEVVEILAEPILLTYSKGKGKGQLITVPVALLEMKCRANEETISIRDYLIKEINQLKKGYRNNDIINYDNLLAYIGFEPGKSERTEKHRITEEIQTILDGLIEKGYIKRYDVMNGQRNKTTGFKIVCE